MYLHAVKQCSFSVFQTALSKSFLDFPIKSHDKSIQLEYYNLAEKARLVHTVEGAWTGVKGDEKTIINVSHFCKKQNMLFFQSLL